MVRARNVRLFRERAGTLPEILVEIMELNKVSSPAFLNSSPIDLQHLRYAVCAQDYGSFRQAAEVLSVRQSTLSRTIRQLEQSIGIVLFERSSGGVRPTQAGHGILRMAKTVLNEFESLIATARANSSGAAGRLTVGFCSSLSAGNLRATLIDFKQRCPDVKLATMEGSSEDLIAALRNGTLDILTVIGDVRSLPCRSLALWSERILVAFPAGHKLADRDVIYWTDLRNENVLLSERDQGTEFENLLNAKLVSPSDRPKIERHNVSRGAIKALVSMQMGVSLILESDLGASLPSPLYRDLRDGNGSSRLDFSAFWLPDNQNPALESFLKLLRERYPSPVAVD